MADLMRGSIADLEDLSAAAHIEPELRPREGQVEDALPKITCEEQCISGSSASGCSEEPHL
ncbi:hypothetical protein ABXW85_23345, partial [Streptococcus suis]